MEIDKFQKGVYAIVVYGRVPEDVEDELDRRGVTYRPRDGSVKDQKKRRKKAIWILLLLEMKSEKKK